MVTQDTFKISEAYTNLSGIVLYNVEKLGP